MVARLDLRLGRSHPNTFQVVTSGSAHSSLWHAATPAGHGANIRQICMRTQMASFARAERLQVAWYLVQLRVDHALAPYHAR